MAKHQAPDRHPGLDRAAIRTTALAMIGLTFFVIAMIFILFDVEIAFLYPWALVFRADPIALLIEMVVFLVILAVGYAYIWKKGAFDW